MCDQEFEEAIRASQECRKLLTRAIALINLADETERRKKRIACDTTMNATMRDTELKKLFVVEQELTRLRNKEQSDEEMTTTTTTTTPSLNPLSSSGVTLIHC